MDVACGYEILKYSFYGKSTMTIVTFQEIIDVAIMTAGVGFIFMDYFHSHKKVKVDEYGIPKHTYGFDWNAFLFACMVTAPAVILHELLHKAAALSYGLNATFHAAYFWLVIGVMLKLFKSPFIFFVPGYVSISTAAAASQTAVIAFVGPLTNGVLWLGSWLWLKHGKPKGRTVQFLYITKQINMFLFIFNMLPIPGFDGFTFYRSLYQAFLA